jgi:antitoxin PrlF
MVAKVTSKGQVTIPLKIRKKLGISYGDEVDFRIIDGGVILEAANKMIDVEDLKGILQSSRIVSDKEIQLARSKALSEKWKSK